MTVRPEELRLLANEYRNLAMVARRLLKQQLELDIGGAMNGLLTAESAMAQAVALEERAVHLELIVARMPAR